MDISRVKQILEAQDVRLTSESEFAEAFPDCEVGTMLLSDAGAGGAVAGGCRRDHFLRLHAPRHESGWPLVTTYVWLSPYWLSSPGRPAS